MARPEILATLESLSRDRTQPDRVVFTKMQGLGNDYIYVEEFDAPLANPAPLAIAVSDRHFGVGSDGLVLIGKASPASGADFRMRIFNADGSEAEMCGNATRCVGKYLYEKHFIREKRLSLETLSGVRRLELFTEGPHVARVRVDMGEPRLAPADLPLQAEGDTFIDQDVVVQGRLYKGTAVSMGNPHLVIPMPGLESLDLGKIGPLFEHHPLFPRRVNTEFVQVENRERIRMRVWERGAGETLACGTGACAVLVACSLNNWTKRRAFVELPGGELDIDWADDGRVYMTGEAAFVCSGEYFVR
ncbi:MAG: diaminopimelate epimerase [Desulfovibrio sp.]|jgi:diaminopimelate epimerase|nr:diaminopimelate epimerase [Desulfovibrio sp.]